MMLRLSALTIPEVTDMPTPSGLPIAKARSPTRNWSLSANSSTGSGFSVSTFSSARSTRLATPTTRAGSRLWSGMTTEIVSAPSMTWRFVTMYPSGLTISPEP